MEESLTKKAKQSKELKDKSVEVESKVQQAVGKATTAVFETMDLTEGLLKEDKRKYLSLGPCLYLILVMM